MISTWVVISAKTDKSCYVVPYSQLDKVAGDFDLVIFDEGHYLANPKAQRTQYANTIKAGRKIILTGTPITSYPQQLWSLLSILDADTWGVTEHDFKLFQNRYCAPRLTKVKTRQGWKQVYVYTGLSNGEELNRRLRSSVMVRRMKKDVLPELPAKTRRVVKLTPSNTGIMSHWKPDSSDDYDTTIRKLRADKIAFEEWSTARHKQGLNKVPAAAIYIRDMLKEVSCVIVFVHHRDVLNALHTLLYKEMLSVVCVHGDTPTNDSIDGRKAQVESFQNGVASVILGTYGAMGTGWTMTRASTVVCVELPLTPGELSQAEDRAHRIGQQSNVDVHHLVEDGSIDATIVKLLLRKQAMMNEVLK
jgi:SWI/SNF-related matrix-associated actin-dependent regulator 1 of chromatin subfamily A